MEFHVSIRAAIRNYDESVVGIASLQQSREHDSTRRNAKHNNRLNLVRAEKHFEVRSRKGADTMFRQYDVSGLRPEGWVIAPDGPWKNSWCGLEDLMAPNNLF